MQESLEHQDDLSSHQDKIPQHCFIFQKNHNHPVINNYISVPYVLDENVMVHGHIT